MRRVNCRNGGQIRVLCYCKNIIVGGKMAQHDMAAVYSVLVSVAAYVCILKKQQTAEAKSNCQKWSCKFRENQRNAGLHCHSECR